nr:DUF551 domain-containing protein [Escherichia coli]
MTTITREQAQKIIEAADEVISALAGTNEDVHPGSDNMLRLWDDLNDRYAPPEVVRELARIALASLEAEPVLYQSCTRPTWNSGVPWTEWKERSRECYEDDLRFTDTPDHAGWINKCRKLYTTPPAPIALEAIENAIEYIRSIAFHIDEDDYHGKHIAYFMRQALVWLEGHSCSNDRQGKAENQPVRGNQTAESNRGNEWTGNPDIDNAIIMLDRIDTLESCDDDRIEAVKAVLRRLAGNSPVIPGEVLSAIMKVARVRADFDDFDGDRRGIGDCLDEAEQELIVTINKYASQLAAEPIATNDVREQQTAVPPVPEIQADVAQAIENLKQKLVECNRYNYCADAVKGVEDACHAAMLQGIQPVSQTYKFPVNTPCQDAPAHIWLQTAGVWPEDGELSELTWCSHNQHHDDTLYVRADLVNGNSPVTPDGWISCSEQMPEMGERQCYVLAADFKNNYPPSIPNTQVGVYGDWFNDGNPTWDDGDGEDLHLKEVTHWMPLPEPPQEAK